MAALILNLGVVAHGDVGDDVDDDDVDGKDERIAPAMLGKLEEGGERCDGLMSTRVAYDCYQVMREGQQ